MPILAPPLMMSGFQPFMAFGSGITWNPSDKGANITLSNGNLDATNSASSWNAVRATGSKNFGRWYWEVKYQSGDPTYAMIGFGDSGFSLSSFVGATAKGASIQSATGDQSSGYTRNYDSSISASANDIIMLALDLQYGKAWVGRNGTWAGSGNPATGVNPWISGITSAVFPAVSIDNTSTSTVRANFGATAFSYPLPS